MLNVKEKAKEVIKEYENALNSRGRYFGYIYGVNSRSVRDEAKLVAAEIERMGYFTYVGWAETTPNGNERTIIQILNYKPKYSNSDDESMSANFKIVIILLLVILVIGLILLLFLLS